MSVRPIVRVVMSSLTLAVLACVSGCCEPSEATKKLAKEAKMHAFGNAYPFHVLVADPKKPYKKVDVYVRKTVFSDFEEPDKGRPNRRKAAVAIGSELVVYCEYAAKPNPHVYGISLAWEDHGLYDLNADGEWDERFDFKKRTTEIRVDGKWLLVTREGGSLLRRMLAAPPHTWFVFDLKNGRWRPERKQENE